MMTCYLGIGRYGWIVIMTWGFFFSFSSSLSENGVQGKVLSRWRYHNLTRVY
ncbi:hypothetical protein DL95DRAFT_24140 [Leptodontidium sp. 2 PMI_412]|nr:hypothetical protein DL95DRAFT_24140 [Leptodontidium sp. 2 PMI_412]